MILPNMLLKKVGTRRKASDNTAVLDNSDMTIAFEMSLHVPCRVAGFGRNGSRWEGEAVTTSISSFGAHLELPWDAELEGDISIILRIPACLRILFEKKTFLTKAEVKPSDALGREIVAARRKVVYVSFAEPVTFKLR
jgi:hypothetical protein